MKNRNLIKKIISDMHYIRYLQKSKRLFENVIPANMEKLSVSELGKFFDDISSGLENFFSSGKKISDAINKLKDSEKDDEKSAYKVAAEISKLIDKDITSILGSLKKSISEFSEDVPDKKLIPGLYFSVLASKLSNEDFELPKESKEKKEGYEDIEDLDKLKLNQIIEIEKGELSTDIIKFGNKSYNISTKNKKVKFELGDDLEYNFVIQKTIKDKDDGKEYIELKFLSKQEFK